MASIPVRFCQYGTPEALIEHYGSPGDQWWQVIYVAGDDSSLSEKKKKEKRGWEVALIKEELDWNKQDDE